MAKYHLTLLLALWWMLLADNSVNGGIVYTHWGRQLCDSADAQLVYTGYVGGNLGTNPGGGSNYLCLPRDPTFANYDSTMYDRSKIYGTEYQNGGSGGNFPFDVPEETPLDPRNALCAVCRVESVSTVLMIPGRADCYTGWTMQYTGYLVSGFTNNYRSEYVCLDKSPETAPGDNGAEDSAHFLSVEGVCGALPCPPYEQGWEIACVVCTN